MVKQNKPGRPGSLKVFIFLAALVLPGCKPEATMPMYEQVVTPPRDGAFPSNRFKVELVGLSGIGISELGSHKSGKARHSDER